MSVDQCDYMVIQIFSENSEANASEILESNVFVPLRVEFGYKNTSRQNV